MPSRPSPSAAPGYVVVQTIWMQVSSDYQAEKGTRTLAVSAETTVAEIMEWAKWKGLGAGDVMLTRSESLPPAPESER